jgi:hypothetical protein
MIQSSISREGAFQELLGLARHSYLAYVLESSAPVVVDDADRKLLALFQEMLEKERFYVERAYELVETAGLGPMPPTFTIKSSNFNFLRLVKLAEHASDQIGFEIDRLAGLKGRVRPTDPCGQEFERLVDDFLALRRDEARRIAEARPRPAPAPVPPAPAGPAASAAPTPAKP